MPSRKFLDPDVFEERKVLGPVNSHEPDDWDDAEHDWDEEHYDYYDDIDDEVWDDEYDWKD